MDVRMVFYNRIEVIYHFCKEGEGLCILQLEEKLSVIG